MARKRHPKTVKIGYMDFHINPRTRRWANRNKAMGMITFQNHHKQIEYDKTEVRNEIANTILHEILHGIAYVFDIHFKSAREEEKFVRTMANGLSTVFKDNPDILKWLVSEYANN